MQRELEEAERLRLEEARQQAKDKEKKVEEQHAVALAVEWRWATLEAPLSQAGPSRAPLRQPEQTLGGSKKVLGSVSQKKNCTWCVAWKSLCLWDLDGYAWSCQRS